MIRFLFEETDPARKEETPPSSCFRIDHAAIRREPDNQFVAHLLPDGALQTGNNRHLRGTCAGRASVCFEDGGGIISRCFGPYDRVRITAGAIFAGTLLIALFLEDSRTWASVQDHTHWPAVVVEAA